MSHGHIVKSALAGFIVSLLSTTAFAETRTFDVPAGELSAALDQYIQQTGVQLIYRVDQLKGVQSQGVVGEYETEKALAMVLAGTEFVIAKDESGAMAVANVNDVKKAGADGPARNAVPNESAVPAEAAITGAGMDAIEAGVTQKVETVRRGGIEEIIVTAQKRAERIQDIPIAISAFTQDDLTRSQIAGGPDLITQIPNFTFTKTNFSGYSIQIRGIGTQAISATTDPAVAVAFNNTPFIRNRFFEQEFYDLDRVEVLRGPQGTLYGRNATAGVVNLISAKPEFFTEARASVDIGNYNSHRLEQMVNIPLVEDIAALRFAAAWTKREGYAENAITENPIDGRDLWSTRTSLRIKPNDIIEANLIWEHFEESDDRLRSGKQLCDKDVVTEVAGIATPDYLQTMVGGGLPNIFAGVQSTFSQGCKRNSLYAAESFQTPNGLMLPYYLPLGAIGLPTALYDPYLTTVQQKNIRAIESTIDPQYRAKSDIGELQLTIAVADNLTLSSETSYSDDTVYSLQDFNRFNTAPGAWQQPLVNDTGSSTREGVLQVGPNGGIFCDPQLGCSDRLVAVDISTAESRQFSQELRLASDFDGAFNFSIGANYLRYSTEDKYYIFFNSTSLIAAGVSAFGDYAPYVGGVTDNSDCLANGYMPGDPNGVYSVSSCIYMDPNPIGSLNDQGHNYFLSRNPYELRSYAVFGESYYKLTPNLKLTAGLRWSIDKKEAPRIPSWVLASNSVGYPVDVVIKQEWREPTGRLVLDWKPDLGFTNETLLYGSYARGYKAGGANPPGFVRTFYDDIKVAEAATTTSATKPRLFEPEFVNAFEIGAKNTLFDGRLTANLAAFYYDYSGYQISEIVDRSAYNRNLDAKIWGLEIETDWYALENLKLGFKGGYQKTRIADGEKAIDLMDRTAGNPDWVVVKPFPTFAASCILPTELFVGSEGGDPFLVALGGVGGGSAGGCELAYIQGYDPVTVLPYVPNPTVQGPSLNGVGSLAYHPNYAGWDPATAPNNGEGIDKDLSGNELPNAPNYTVTVTGDFTIPLANAWTMTLHADVHWQSKSWWRVFNDHEYARLDDYYTANFAAIFVNEPGGWNIMAYIKNVFDETSISGAFLNSDDTGLTTNIFLTDPRLYGLRVTKLWSGQSLLGNFGARRNSDRPWPITLELGGQVQHVDAPGENLQPSFASAFASPLNVLDTAQNEGLGWGQAHEAKLSWRPDSGAWMLSAAYRQGRLSKTNRADAERYTDPVCTLAGGIFEQYCDDPEAPALFDILNDFSVANRADAVVMRREDYSFFDLSLSRDLVFGGLSRSTLAMGLRRARFDSSTDAQLRGVPDWVIPEDLTLGDPLPGNHATHTVYNATLKAQRSFVGTGPVVTWDASTQLFGNKQAGHVELDWSLSGGVLFGDQKASLSGAEQERYYEQGGVELAGISTVPPAPQASESRTLPVVRRNESVSVPTFGASLGLTYRVAGASIGAGYRWERYLNAIDGGDAQQSRRDDRTIDGPTLKVTIGFGD